MQDQNALARSSAARLAASTFGVLAGLGGIRHGIGEIRQGNVAPSGIWIDSWVEGPIATNMGGEPGITLVPNVFVTGVLALIVSLAVVVWAAAFVQRKNGGWILILLSIAMLLVGGGIGPPTIGILAGVAGLGIGAPLTWWRRHLPANARRFLATLWPWVFGASVLNGGFLFVASALLVYFFGVNNPDLFLNSFFFAVLSLLLTIVTGVAYDIEYREPDRHLSVVG